MVFTSFAYPVVFFIRNAHCDIHSLLQFVIHQSSSKEENAGGGAQNCINRMWGHNEVEVEKMSGELVLGPSFDGETIREGL